MAVPIPTSVIPTVPIPTGAIPTSTPVQKPPGPHISAVVVVLVLVLLVTLFDFAIIIGSCGAAQQHQGCAAAPARRASPVRVRASEGRRLGRRAGP